MRDLPLPDPKYSARSLDEVTPVKDMVLRKQVAMLFVRYSKVYFIIQSNLLNYTSLGAAGAIAVTLPTCWYLLSNAPDTSHGHGDHGEDHGKSHGEEETEEEPEEKSEEKDEADDKDSEKSEDSDSDGDAKEADTPDTSEDEGDEGTKEDGNTKSIPDAKGGSKKRIESNKGEKQGEVGGKGEDGEPTDKVCPKQRSQKHALLKCLGVCLKRDSWKELSVFEARRLIKYRHQALYRYYQQPG